MIRVHEETTRRGFTMVEMMVVLAVIILAAGIALPSISTLLAAGADKQAYNMISAQIRAARSVAIQRGTYAGLHIQLADASANPELEGVCFSAMVELVDRSGGDAEFDLADGYSPQRVPGTIAFGDLSNEEDEVFGGGGDFAYDDPQSFTTMTIVFSPNGRIVHSVQGKKIRIDPDSDLVNSGGGRPRLWRTNRTSPDRSGTQMAEYGTAAICLFNFKEFDTSGDKGAYMDRNAILLPINVHTGQLFPLD